MAWYKTGTVSVTNSSATVTGSGTLWVANVKPGDMFIGPDLVPREILSVVSNTSLTLADNYTGTTSSGASYSIAPTQGYVRDLAAAAQALVTSFSDVATYAGNGRFLNGTVSAPGVASRSDTDTGLVWTDANELIVAAGGAEVARLSSSGLRLLGAGPYIGAVEQNTFTPEIADASSGGNIGSAATAQGSYVKIGSIVVVTVLLTDIVTTGMTGANDLTIRNLPYAARSYANTQYFLGACRLGQVSFDGSVSAAVFDNNSFIRFPVSKSGSGAVNLKVSDLTSGSSDIACTVTYEV